MTRAYFTAATDAISFNKTLSVIAPLLFFQEENIKNYVEKEITIWNPLGWAMMSNKSQLSNTSRNMYKLTLKAERIIIGLMLSDGWMQKRGHWNPRFALKQSIKNYPYLMNTHYHLAYLCSGFPFGGLSKLRNNLFYSLTFYTRQLSCLTEIFHLFYKLDGKKYIRCINEDLFNYMDYIVLAHWIQGDGNKHRKGLVLNTQGFTLKEVIFLMNILIYKFKITPSLQNDRGNYRIYIKGKDLSMLKPHILPFFVEHFLYKLG